MVIHRLAIDDELVKLAKTTHPVVATTIAVVVVLKFFAVSDVEFVEGIGNFEVDEVDVVDADSCGELNVWTIQAPDIK